MKTEDHSLDKAMSRSLVIRKHSLVEAWQQSQAGVREKVEEEKLETGSVSIILRNYALAGVAQWSECRPINRKVAGSTARQGTCLGYGIYLSLSFSLPSSLKINKLN